MPIEKKSLISSRAAVKKAIIASGGMAAFGLPETFTRSEVIAA